jgi:hypothetical protein
MSWLNGRTSTSLPSSRPSTSLHEKGEGRTALINKAAHGELTERERGGKKINKTKRAAQQRNGKAARGSHGTKRRGGTMLFLTARSDGTEKLLRSLQAVTIPGWAMRNVKQGCGRGGQLCHMRNTKVVSKPVRNAPRKASIAPARLREENVKMMACCIELDRDCALICAAAAKFMARGSEFSADICRTCAEICRACAEECRKHDNEHCQSCAGACENCQRSARRWRARRVR